MSFVCHSKKPSCAGAGGEATKRYGAVVSRVVRRRTLRRGRVAGVGASGRGRSKADGPGRRTLTFFFGATASPPATAEKPAVEQGRFRARGAERWGGSYLARIFRFVKTPVARTNARGARGSCFGCRRL